MTKKPTHILTKTLGPLLAVIMLLCLVAIIVDSQDDHIGSSTVDGALVAYEDKVSGRTRHMFVNIMFSDGTVRQYNTYIHPDQCKRHVLGLGVTFKIDQYVNSITGKTRTTTEMTTNPCQ